MRNSNAVGLLKTRINAVWQTLGGHSAPPSFICPCVIEKMESGLPCCSAAAVCPQLQGDDAREWRGTPSTSPGERGGCSEAALCFCCFCLVPQSCPTLLRPPWAVAHQAPLSMGFSRQECWTGLPFPPPGDLLYPGIELASPALAGGFFTSKLPGNPDSLLTCGQIFFTFFFSFEKLKISTLKHAAS